MSPPFVVSLSNHERRAVYQLQLAKLALRQDQGERSYLIFPWYFEAVV